VAPHEVMATGGDGPRVAETPPLVADALDSLRTYGEALVLCPLAQTDDGGGP